MISDGVNIHCSLVQNVWTPFVGWGMAKINYIIIGSIGG